MGVATGITMEFQFGTNWAYYSHYVGDVFGAPLAIEGLMAFFLEATFIGLFFFGWNRLSKVGHLVVTWLVALGSNLSALWILIANGWMQHPVGARFNPDTMRMEVTDFMAVIFNPVAQAKFVHTVSAGYVTGSMFVLAISAFYLLRGRHVELAKRSMTVAASFGLASALSVVVLGDESGYTAGREPEDEDRRDRGDVGDRAGAGVLHGLRHSEHGDPHHRLRSQGAVDARPDRRPARSARKCPASRSWSRDAEHRIRSGLIAYDALQKLKADRSDQRRSAAALEQTADDLGYALLLKKIRPDIAQRHRTTRSRRPRGARCPPVSPLFWSFRIMVGLGFFFIALFAVAFYLACDAAPPVVAAASCGWRSSACRCRGSPPSSAGSSPKSGASPG